MASIVKRDRPRPYMVYFLDEVGHHRGRSFLSYADAKTFKATCELKKRRGGDGSAIDLEAAATLFLTDKLTNGGPTTTAERYHQAIKQFIGIVGNKPLHRLTQHEVEAYKADRMQHVSSRTVWNNLKVVKTLLNWCVRKRLLNESPAKEVEQPKFKTRIPTWPDDEDLDKILPAAQKHDRSYYRLILLSAFAGLRRAEMLNLKRQDFDFRARVIRVQLTKSKHPRIVPMHALLVQELGAEAREGWLFPSPVDATKHASMEVTKHCCAWLRSSGFPFVLHAFRHSFASRCARIPGMTLETLQSLLGHTSVRMALHYMHSTSAQRAALVEQLRCPGQGSGTRAATTGPMERAS